MTMLHDPVGWWNSLGRPLRHLPRSGAIALLAGLLLALAWSSYATTEMAMSIGTSGTTASDHQSIGDLELYSRINERVRSGENYYAAAMAEQRANDYPTTPFVTVRPPAMAWGDALWGAQGWRAVAIALLVANILAWLGRLSNLASLPERATAALLLFLSGIGAFNANVGLIHELVAGLLLSLALALYRPERWWPSLLVAGLALAVRELAAPFVLLWGAFALSQRRWREATAVGGLLALFAIMLWLHAQGVAAHASSADLPSQGWVGMAGLQMALYSMSRLTALLFLPMWLAAPLALLPLLGWIGLGGRLGLFASLWFIGFGLALALFARTTNFYWALLMLPAYAAGMALVPRALADLAHALKVPQQSQS